MESLTNYFSKVFKKTMNCEDELDSELGSQGKLESDSLANDPNKAWMKRRKCLKKTKIIPVDANTPVRDDHVRFVCISDTHAKLEKQRNLMIPNGDVLVHAGDLTMYGDPDEVHLVNDYLGTLPHKHKVVIAGNHDNTFDLEFNGKKKSTMMWSLSPDNYESRLKFYNVTTAPELLTNCTYLQDSAVEIYGIKIYGCPWTAGKGAWGFQRLRGPKLMEKWNKIPSNTDILVTHSPPCGYGDNANSLSGALLKLTGHSDTSNHVGCVDLLNTVNLRVKPQYHIFGHIHEGYGMYTDGTTTYVNASICTRNYLPTNLPIVFDIALPEGHSKDECVLLEKHIEHSPADSDVEESENENVEENNDCDKEYLNDWLSYRPDGKTNYEKLTMDNHFEADFENDDEDDASFVEIDSKYGDKKNLDADTSEAVGDGMNQLIPANKSNDDPVENDGDDDCEVVFEDNADGIQLIK